MADSSQAIFQHQIKKITEGTFNQDDINLQLQSSTSIKGLL